MTMVENVMSTIESGMEFMKNIKEYWPSNIIDKYIIENLMRALTTKKVEWF